jgi:hypothetical protein
MRANLHKTELIMDAIVDLTSELIVDRARVCDPYLRLLLAAIGQELAKGSPWVAVDKKAAAEYGLVRPALDPQVAA